MDVGGHGIITIIKRTITSEEAAQIHIGYGMETLLTPIMAQQQTTITTQYIQSGWSTG